MSGSVKDINDGNFKSEVLDAGGLVVVEFCAAWSDVCRSMEGTVKQAATNYKDKAQIAKLDIDESPQDPAGVRRHRRPHVPRLQGREGGRHLGWPDDLYAPGVVYRQESLRSIVASGMTV